MKQGKLMTGSKLFGDGKNNRTRQDITKPGKSAAAPQFTVNRNITLSVPSGGNSIHKLFVRFKTLMLFKGSPTITVGDLMPRLRNKL